MSTQIVNAENLSLIVWNKTPVVTTDLLAQLYGTEPNNIIQNFTRNSDRFIEGKHFFKLEGEALREFKSCMTESHSVQIAKYTRNLTLWTERGAARHAKMLDTEQAWEMFEKLEDVYFRVKEIVTSATITPAQQLQIRRAVSKVAKGSPENFSKVYHRLYDAFAIGKYEQLPAARFDEAVEFLAALEGEFLPKPEPVNCAGFFSGDFFAFERIF